MTQAKAIYTTNGFEWTAFLEEFLRERMGQVIYYPHFKTGDLVSARMVYLPLVQVGADYSLHRRTRAFLGEGYAPVGECNNGNIDLFLTNSGKLIGFADYMFLTWGGLGGRDWRMSLERIFAGEEPECIGVVPKY